VTGGSHEREEEEEGGLVGRVGWAEPSEEKREAGLRKERGGERWAVAQEGGEGVLHFMKHFMHYSNKFI